MFVTAALQCIYDIICENYDTSAWNLPMRVSVPFNTDSVLGWFLLLFIQLNISAAYSLTVIAVTSYFICCCLYLEAMCDHFDELINLVKGDVEINRKEKNRSTSRKSEHQIWKNLCDAIKIHGDLYEWVYLKN